MDASYRTARGTTSHTYDSVKAADVFAKIPLFSGGTPRRCSMPSSGGSRSR